MDVHNIRFTHLLPAFTWSVPDLIQHGNTKGLEVGRCLSFPVYHHLCHPTLHRAMLRAETSSCKKRQDLHRKWVWTEIPHLRVQHQCTSPQSQRPCLYTEVAEVYLKPGLKPSALNLCKPPSPNVNRLILPRCLTIRYLPCRRLSWQAVNRVMVIWLLSTVYT